MPYDKEVTGFAKRNIFWLLYLSFSSLATILVYSVNRFTALEYSWFVIGLIPLPNPNLSLLCKVGNWKLTGLACNFLTSEGENMSYKTPSLYAKVLVLEFRPGGGVLLVIFVIDESCFGDWPWPTVQISTSYVPWNWPKSLWLCGINLI